MVTDEVWVVVEVSEVVMLVVVVEHAASLPGQHSTIVVPGLFPVQGGD